MTSSPNDVRWFYSQDGCVSGPVAADDIVGLAKSGRLRPDDLIRPAGTSTWTAVHSLEQSLSEDQSSTGSAQQQQAARDAAREIAQAAAAKFGQKKTAARRAKSPRSASQRGVMDVIAAVIEFVLASVVALLGTVLQYRLVQMAVVVFGVSAVGWWAWSFASPRLPISSEPLVTEYESLWNDIQQAADDSATAVEWERLNQRRKDLIDRTRDRIAWHASHRRPELQELSACADLFEEALTEIRAAGPKSPAATSTLAAAKFAIHLTAAREKTGRQSELSGGNPGGGLFDSSIVVWSIIIADVLIVAAIGWFVLRRSK